MMIQHDMISMNAAGSYRKVNRKQQKSMEKLSSGYRINRAGDDAASLAISEKMRGQIRGLNQASINVETGISLIQTADGAMQEVNDILNRMRTLGVQAANDTNTDDDREELQKEVVQLRQEINRIGKETEFNTIKILQGKGGLIREVWIPDGEKKVEHTVEFKTLVHFEDTDHFDDDITKSLENVKQQFPNMGSTIQCSKTIDFSNITNENKHLLLGDNKSGGVGFSFGCSQSCSQNFSFEFVEHVDSTKAAQKYAAITESYGIYDTTPDNIIAKHHSKKFLVAIDHFTSGAALASNIANYVRQMNVIDGAASNANIYTACKVGHANYLFADGGKVILGGDSTSATDKTEAQRKYKLFHSDNLTEIKEEIKVEVPGHWATIYPEKIQMRIQAGSNAGQEINIELPQIDEQFLEITDVDVSTHEKAVDSLEMVDKAVGYVNGERTRMGAYQNRMEHAVLSLDNAAENLQAAESRIRDLNMASEMVEFSKNNILQQSGSAVLSNGTDISQNILQLLP